MRILIIEEALREDTGHWPAYIGTLARGLRASSDEVDILGHTDCGRQLCAVLRVNPVLRANCWLDTQYQGTLGGMKHSQVYRSDIRTWLEQAPGYDWILVLTTRLQHLLAWTRLITGGERMKGARLLLLFVQGFGRYESMRQAVYFPTTMSTLIARSCFHLLSPWVSTGKVHLGAETVAMQRELSLFSKLPVKVFPHPVSAAGIPKERAVRGDEPVVNCPGLARYEKGSALLRQALNLAMGREGLARVRFIVQWKEGFDLPDGKTVGAPPEWVGHPRITLVRDNLAAEDFFQLLLASDLVLLPYRREAYHNRLSRIAIEAAIIGRPVLYTRGTAIAELMEVGAAGVALEDESADAIIRGLERAVADFEALAKAAVAAVPRVREHHSVATFRGGLIRLAGHPLPCVH